MARADGVEFSVDREGPRVLLALRSSTASVTLDMHYRGAAALATTLRAASEADDELDASMTIRGDLSVGVTHD
jgi:hypothetical protein